MTLESQVASLELSKKLKELGVKQESLFVWVTDTRKQKPHFIKLEGSPSTIIMSGYVSKVSAFTVAELGELIVETGHGMMPNYSNQLEKGWYRFILTRQKQIFATTEADARAKMLIYLLENKLITI